MPELHKVDSLVQYKSEKGCDSAYSWHPNFRHLATKYDVVGLWDQIYGKLPLFARAILDVEEFLPAKSMPAISITGGEPLLHQKFWAKFFASEGSTNFIRKLIIETNCSVPIQPEFAKSLKGLEDRGCLIVWANSPKLSNSGERHSRSIRPEIVYQQQQLGASAQYFKFVSNGSSESFTEISEVVQEYNNYLMKNGGERISDEQVYVMPEGALKEQQELVQRKVADMCLEHGYSFCARVHCWVYDNEIGT